MKRTLIFFGILCMIFFLLFSSVYRRTQFLTSLAGPGMLSLVKQASAKATALENFLFLIIRTDRSTPAVKREAA